MALKLVESRKTTPCELRQHRETEKDFDYFVDHSLEIWKKYKGKYVTAVNSEIVSGDSLQEVQRKVHGKYPKKKFVIRHIPYKRKMRYRYPLLSSQNPTEDCFRDGDESI